MKVNVIGGGIGGLTAALSMQKQGMDVTLYEAALELRAAGAGIWMSPNSIKVMEYLGLADRFRKRSVEMERVALENREEKIISDSPMDFVKQKHGYAIHAVKRQTLHDLLAEDIEPGRIVTGKRAVDLRQEKDKVIVKFEDGSSEESDVLVGADGIHSVVREAVQPGIPLRYSGQSCWYGLARMKLSPKRARMTTELWMGRLRFGYTSVNEEEVYFFAVETSPPNIRIEKDRMTHLRKLFADSPDVVKEILHAAREEDIIKSDLNDIKPFIPLAYGRVALLGDAGHATTPNMGQGAAQAMEDGVLLADLLAKESPERAIALYERRRRERIKYIVGTSFKLGQLAHEEKGWKQKMIHGVLRNTPEFLNRRILNKAFTPVFP